MPFEVKILGSNSATPVYNRHQSAQLVYINQHAFLVDCGESTQLQLLRYKIKFNRINHIFISHLHGDHYLGVIGLISTMHLQGRKADLHLYGPPGLDEILVIQLKYSESFLAFKIIFKELDTESITTILETEHILVETIPLKHRIKCCGFLFREKPKKRRINKLKVADDISLVDIISLKNGEDVTDSSGAIIYKNEEVTHAPKRSRSYAYCSDTIYMEILSTQLRDIDMLYHESTFADDLLDRAKYTYHTTASQAATIAVKSNVKKLIIGHFSSRYKDLGILHAEAKAVFENTFLAIEGTTFEIEE